MKKVFAMMALAATISFVACNEKKEDANEQIENTADSMKDNVDSAANQQKDNIDSAAEMKKDAIDSAAATKKDINDNAKEQIKKEGVPGNKM